MIQASYVQLQPALADLDENIRRLEPLLEECRGSDLVVLPELCSTGYNFESPAQAESCAEELSSSRFVEYLQARSRDLGCDIVGGIAEKQGGTLYNSAVLVGPEGLVASYRKLHLFDREKEIFAPGDRGVSVVRREHYSVGMLICFDWIFPEVWRILAVQGADVIAHPSNLVLPERCQKALPVHAMINRIFAICANRTGTEGDLTFTGCSLIADPAGRVLAHASAEGSEVGTARLDLALARDKQVTPRNHIIEDRRPEHYRGLVQD